MRGCFFSSGDSMMTSADIPVFSSTCSWTVWPSITSLNAIWPPSSVISSLDLTMFWPPNGSFTSSRLTRPTIRSRSGSITSPDSMIGRMSIPSTVPQSCSLMITSWLTSTRRRVR